ncbi:MAG: lytic transglycosylase domain-containing protein [Actinopolymorphaceae bacterium]
MRRQDRRPRVLPALTRVFCLMVVATVGLAGTVAWAPRTMLGGPPGSGAHKSSEESPFSSTAPPITLEDAEEAAESALHDKVDGAPGAGPGVLGIPAPMLAAYRRAAATLARTDPGCHLTWWVLAGIGKVESNHARGGRVDAKGRTNGEILGPRLDGSLANTAVIRDSDDGRLDRDSAYDRAVGPMQFLPGTWRTWTSDGNDDGVRDPHNIHDATLAAGRYLCAGSGDLSTPSGLARAILRYNPSGAYLRSVLGWAASYRDGGRPVPAETGPVSSGPEPPRRGSLPDVPGIPGPIRDLPSADPPPDSGPGTRTTLPPNTRSPEPTGPRPTPPPEDPKDPDPPKEPDPPKDPPDPQPPDDPKPTPTPTSNTPTPTPTPTSDPSPTPTDPAPTPTCPAPTEGTPTPSPTPTPTPTPTGTPTPSPTCPEPEPTNATPTASPAPDPA